MKQEKNAPGEERKNFGQFQPFMEDAHVTATEMPLFLLLTSEDDDQLSWDTDTKTQRKGIEKPEQQ